MKTDYNIAPHVQNYFQMSLRHARNLSDNTIKSYRDTFRILLEYSEKTLGVRHHRLTLEHLDSELIGKFLTHLEIERNNSIATRNNRLAAIQSFFDYILPKVPELINHCHKILSIPYKKQESSPMDYLYNEECQAILDSIDSNTWYEKRDKLILRVMIETGLRVSEFINIKVADIYGPTISVLGKGKKLRTASLYDQTTEKVTDWISSNRLEYGEPVFGSRQKTRLSRDSIDRIVKKYTGLASSSCPTLKRKNITPHSLRHTFAMRNLEIGVNIKELALLMGHEDIKSTSKYLHASNAIKRQALEMLDRLDDNSPKEVQSDENKMMDYLDSL